MKKIVFIIAQWLLHLSAVGAIIYFFLPLAKWYFDASPLWGVDFYYTASLVKLLMNHFSFPVNGWFYAWFGGWPWLSSFPLLHAYLILPFTSFLGITAAVKMWMLASLGLYFAGIYAACYRVSKNTAFAVVIALSAIFTVGVYGSLMWGGSLPSFATQAFYPWTIFFLIGYFQKKQMRDLLLAALVAGLAIWGHPQIVIAYIYPTAGIISLFWLHEWKFWDRMKSLILFVVISFIIGLPLFYQTFGETTRSLVVTNATEVASSTVRVDSSASQDIQAFHLKQPERLITDTNRGVFVILGASVVLWLLSLIFAKERKPMFTKTVPFVALAVFYVAYVSMFAFGISIYHGGWYRLFWATPFWVGLLAASLWGSGQRAFEKRLSKNIFWGVVGILSLVILVGGGVSVFYFSDGVRDKIILRSEYSSAFPDLVNLREDQALATLSPRLLPSWLDPQQTEYRLYSGDQTINIWWSALHAMPLARGYFDPPIPSQYRGYLFWLDASLSQNTDTKEDQLVGSFKYPPQIALKNTLFLLDWYAVKFAEAGHASPTVYAPLPESLTNGGYIKNEESLDFNEEKYREGSQTLHFYEFNDELVSPILTATNAPSLGILASEQGFETVLRAVADAGMGSSEIIPIKLNKKIESLGADDLKNIDALFLYDYDYSNKDRAYRILEAFLKSGKQIFIDTGFEVKEAESKDLPGIYPIRQTVRRPMGSSWDLKIVDDTFSEVAVSLFDPPLFDDAQWNISYPEADSFIDKDTTVILTNKNRPVLARKKTGAGTLFWSGINLPYHVSRFHNDEEAKFFRMLLEQMLPETEETATYTSAFVSPEKREVNFQNAKGALFKEQHFPGWSAKVKSGIKTQSVRVYTAGPAYPGFMYAVIPEALRGRGSVTFQYDGSKITFVFFGISLLFMFYIVDYVCGGFLFGFLTKAFHKRVGRSLFHWWSKDDEE